jgi:hypothetical protein
VNPAARENRNAKTRSQYSQNSGGSPTEPPGRASFENFESAFPCSENANPPPWERDAAAEAGSTPNGQPATDDLGQGDQEGVPDEDCGQPQWKNNRPSVDDLNAILTEVENDDWGVI